MHGRLPLQHDGSQSFPSGSPAAGAASAYNHPSTHKAHRLLPSPWMADRHGRPQPGRRPKRNFERPAVKVLGSEAGAKFRACPCLTCSPRHIVCICNGRAEGNSMGAVNQLLLALLQVALPAASWCLSTPGPSTPAAGLLAAATSVATAASKQWQGSAQEATGNVVLSEMMARNELALTGGFCLPLQPANVVIQTS